MTPDSALSPSRQWLLPAALLWSVIILAVGIVAIGPLDALEPLYGLTDPRVGPAGLGAFAAHAMLCGSDIRRRHVLRIGVILEIARIALLVATGKGGDALLSIGYGFLAAAAGDFLWHREWRRLALAMLVPIGMANAAFGLSAIVRRATPLTYDGALAVLDATLRIPVSTALGELFTTNHLLAAISLISYALLPGAIAAGLGYEQYCIERGLRRGVGVNLLLAYAVSGSIAALLYWLCPGTGPSHAFPQQFPDALPSLQSLPLTLHPFAAGSPRNAMPSLHFAWAVMVWRSLAGARRSLRIAGASFAFLTMLATIGSGEHYVVDLIAAVPFLVALEAATAHRSVPPSKRVLPLWIGVVFYVIWIIIVRYAPVTIPFLSARPVAMWSFTAATIVASALVALRPSIPQTTNAEG